MSTILVLAALAMFIFLMRLIGAWMLRINEVIDKLNEVIIELKRFNNR